ncbi:unnamed protein product [Musa textilis]
MHHHQVTGDGEEAKAAQGAGSGLPPVQLHQHQVLLLQQLQPHAAPVLLQELPEVLDRGRIPQECPGGWWLKKEQEILPDLLHHHETSSSSSAAAAAALPAASSLFIPPSTSLFTSPEAPKFHEAWQDLHQHSHPGNTFATAAPLSTMELLKSGMEARNHLGPFMPEHPSGFGLQQLRPPTLTFPLDGLGGYRSLPGIQVNAGGKLLFPFDDLRPVVPSIDVSDQFHQNKEQGSDPPGFWHGIIGGSWKW